MAPTEAAIAMPTLKPAGISEEARFGASAVQARMRVWIGVPMAKLTPLQTVSAADHRHRIGADGVDHRKDDACSPSMAMSDGISCRPESLPPMKTPRVAPKPVEQQHPRHQAGVEARHLLQQRRDVGVGHELAEHEHQHDDQAGPDLLAAEHAHLAS